MLNQRVVITGCGVITSLGNSFQSLWENSSTHSACKEMKPWPSIPTNLYAPVIDFDPSTILEQKIIWNRTNRYILMAESAAQLAIQDSGWDFQDRENTGVSIGTGISCLDQIYNVGKQCADEMYRRVSPYFIPNILTNSPSSRVSIRFGLQGPNSSQSTACATGNHSIGDAFTMIQTGKTNRVLAGATESCISPIAFAGFAKLQALARPNVFSDPQTASRPFDKDRAGFVIGEGAAVFVIESLETAQKRNANIYAEIVSYATSLDAYHITSPDPEGIGAVSSMTKALKYANLEPHQIDYINAHATSTPIGDEIEAKAIQKVFSSDNAVGNPRSSNLFVSSSKGALGHLLGAAGAVETAICLGSIKHQIVPPTLNLESLDESLTCSSINFPTQAIPSSVNYVMNNSFGFGGTNSTLIFKKL